MEEKVRVIAIDGPGGVGKSSVAKGLARKMEGWFYLDTGAMYRAITWSWIQDGSVDERLSDSEWLDELVLEIDGSHIMMNSVDISKEIRSREVTGLVSQVAASPTVRAALTVMQQEIGRANPCIVDGRDIGTVVFPDAFLKVFLIASPEIRARRRWLQLGGDASPMTEEELVADLMRRDTHDSTRECAPLKAAVDAWKLDTDVYSQEEVTELIYDEAQKRLN